MKGTLGELGPWVWATLAVAVLTFVCVVCVIEVVRRARVGQLETRIFLDELRAEMQLSREELRSLAEQVVSARAEMVAAARETAASAAVPAGADSPAAEPVASIALASPARSTSPAASFNPFGALPPPMSDRFPLDHLFGVSPEVDPTRRSRVSSPAQLPDDSDPFTAEFDRFDMASAALVLPPIEADSSEKGFRQVQTFFATDRAETSQYEDLASRFTGDRGLLQYGVVQVSVPLSHKIGNVERPRWWRLEFSEDQNKHFKMLDIECLDEADYLGRLNTMFEDDRTTRAFVFVHGFNVSFEAAALRTAQIAVDIGLRTVPIFYSWPSQGAVEPYTVDESNAEWTRSNLLHFLELLASKSEAKEIVVIAHSMGSRPTAWAMETLLSRNPSLHGRFRELVLAAPDIDSEVFRRDIVPGLLPLHERITLYASSKDRALKASKFVHGNPRAGDSGPDIVVVRGVDTVDASYIDTDFLGHSYLVSERPLLMDLTMLLQNNIRASERKHLEERPKGHERYWAFRR